MSTPREWVYGILTETLGITSLVGGPTNPRVFAKKSMTSSMEDHPYIVYKLGYKASEDLAEEMPEARDVGRQFVQVFVHDYEDTELGDYTKIDDILREIQRAFHGKSSAEHGVIACKFIEVSQDLNDDTLNTVMKYARLQLAIKETP